MCLSRGCTVLFSQGGLNPSPPRDTAWGKQGTPEHHSLTRASEGSNSPPLMDPVTMTDAITCLAFCPGPARDYSSSSKQHHTHVSHHGARKPWDSEQSQLTLLHWAESCSSCRATKLPLASQRARGAACKKMATSLAFNYLGS